MRPEEFDVERGVLSQTLRVLRGSGRRVEGYESTGPGVLGRVKWGPSRSPDTPEKEFR